MKFQLLPAPRVLQKFWEVDSSPMEGSTILSENKRILECAQNTFQLVDGWCRVSIHG